MSVAREQMTVGIGADSSGFKRQLRTVKADIESFKHGLSELGLAGGAILLYEGFNKLREKIQHTKEVAEGFRVSTDFIQGLGLAANKAGLDAETAEHGFEKFAARISEAREGSAEAQDWFTRLGIAINTVDGKAKSTEQIFFDFADKLHDTEDGAKRARLAIEGIGKAGLSMVPILAEGGEKLKAFIDLKKAQGKIISEEDINNIVEFNRNLRETSGRTLPQLASAFSTLVKWVRDAAYWYGAFFTAIQHDRGPDAIDKATQETIANAAEIKKAIDDEAAARQKLSDIGTTDKSVTRQVEKHLESLSLAEKYSEIRKQYYELENNFAKQQLEDERILNLKRHEAFRLESLAEDLHDGTEAKLKAEKQLEEQKLGIQALEVKMLDRQQERHQKQVDLLKRYTDLQKKERESKADVTKFGAEELANANDVNLSEEARKQKYKLIEAQQLEQRAQSEKGIDEKAAQTDYQKALDIRKTLSLLKSEERDPYASLHQELANLKDEFKKVGGAVLGDTLRVTVAAAVNQPPK